MLLGFQKEKVMEESGEALLSAMKKMLEMVPGQLKLARPGMTLSSSPG